MWVGIGKQILSFVVGVIVAAFILGRNSQKINDVVTWKTEMAPRIERMDSRGTLSFEHFHQGYLKEQAQQYERLKHLEEEVAPYPAQKLKELESQVDYIMRNRWGEDRLQELHEDTKQISGLKARIESLERERNNKKP